jgi:hypothetical protein
MFKSKVFWLNSIKPKGNKQIATLSLLPGGKFSCIVGDPKGLKETIMTSPSPLRYDTYYHIYNRGVNRENIFFEERNYEYFLNLYWKHIEPVVDTFAYCLLRNHFDQGQVGRGNFRDKGKDPKGFVCKQSNT